MSRRVQYARPRRLDQVMELLAAFGTGATLIAGGQELMPFINHGRLSPAVLIDINGLEELGGIALADGDALSIGALTVHRELELNEDVKRLAPLLAHAVTQVGGGWQVRNRGSIGGNIVSMHPLYDIVPPLLALSAHVEIVGESGTRSMPLAEVIRDARHGLGTGALLTRVMIPANAHGCAWGYEKLKFMEGSYASANAAAALRLDAGGRIERLALCIGAVSERPLDLTQELADWVGRSAGEELAESAGRLAVDAVTEPLADQRGDGEYRRAMAGVVARRALQAAIERTANC